MILRFATVSGREAFIEKAKKEAPEMLPRIRVSKTQPTVVTVRTATLNDKRSLREVAGAGATVYDDIEFETFSPG